MINQLCCYIHVLSFYRNLEVIKSNNSRKKMTDKYQQFKEFTLFKEEFIFIVSIYQFLNEQFELKELFNGFLQFEMSYSHFRRNFLRKLEKYAKDSCGVVCYSKNQCDGHRALTYLQKYEDFMIYNVEERNIFYKNISIIKEGKNTDPLMGYVFLPKDMVDLKEKSWSQRLAYLN